MDTHTKNYPKRRRNRGRRRPKHPFDHSRQFTQPGAHGEPPATHIWIIQENNSKENDYVIFSQPAAQFPVLPLLEINYQHGLPYPVHDFSHPEPDVRPPSALSSPHPPLGRSQPGRSHTSSSHVASPRPIRRRPSSSRPSNEEQTREYMRLVGGLPPNYHVSQRGGGGEDLGGSSREHSTARARISGNENEEEDEQHSPDPPNTPSGKEQQGPEDDNDDDWRNFLHSQGMQVLYDAFGQGGAPEDEGAEEEEEEESLPPRPRNSPPDIPRGPRSLPFPLLDRLPEEAMLPRPPRGGTAPKRLRHGRSPLRQVTYAREVCPLDIGLRVSERVEIRFYGGGSGSGGGGDGDVWGQGREDGGTTAAGDGDAERCRDAERQGRDGRDRRDA